MNLVELIRKGGPTIPLLILISIMALSTVIERSWFWFNVLTKEKETVSRVLEACRRDWPLAAERAREAYDKPIGRFLNAPLQLKDPDPDLFRLALESAADDEIASMRRGEKILEGVIALAPLLGLLGTVLGLIVSIGSIRLDQVGTAATGGVTSGIGEALISTATGLVVAIFSLIFYRIFQALVFNQAKIFRKAGNDMEVLFRQKWQAEHAVKRPDDPTPG